MTYHQRLTDFLIGNSIKQQRKFIWTTNTTIFLVPFLIWSIWRGNRFDSAKLVSSIRMLCKEHSLEARDEAHLRPSVVNATPCTASELVLENCWKDICLSASEQFCIQSCDFPMGYMIRSCQSNRTYLMSASRQVRQRHRILVLKDWRISILNR